MKSQLLALVLLGGAMFAHAAADLSMTVSADRPVPWSSSPPVVVSMTITNHASEPRRAWIDIEGIDRFDHLIHYLDVLNPETVEEEGYHPWCVDINPHPRNLIWCLTSKPIAAGESSTIRFALVAYPNAVGFRHVQWTVQAQSSTFGSVPDGARIVVADQLIAYGFVPHQPVPAMNVRSAATLAGLMLLGALIALGIRRLQ